MNPCEIRSALEPTVVALAVAIKALRQIFVGCSATGRWFYAKGPKPVGHNVVAPDSGYYDRNNPPSGYVADGWIGTCDNSEEPPEPLKPCEWEDYTQEEQDGWLETCVDIAKCALEKMGVPLLDPTETG